jgi:DNA-binding response OmpR family regulator
MSVGESRQDRSQQRVLEKSEILLLDADGSARATLTQALTEAGILVTAIADPSRALTLAREKHFSVIVVDADTPDSGQGLPLLEPLGAASPASAVMLLTATPTFEAAADAFRRGAADVCAKSDVEGLVQRVSALCLETRKADERIEVLRETLHIQEELFRRLMLATRRHLELEEQASGQSGTWQQLECRILVVDDNPRTATGLQQALGGEQDGYRCVAALNGGEALDYAGSASFNIALVRDTLPDLPGGMVSRNLHASSGDGVILRFEHPGDEPGFVSIVEGHETIPLVPKLTHPNQLVERVRELRDTFVSRSREKHYIEAFRQEHRDFLQRYVKYRQRLVKLLPGTET